MLQALVTLILTSDEFNAENAAVDISYREWNDKTKNVVFGDIWECEVPIEVKQQFIDMYEKVKNEDDYAMDL